MIPNPQQMPGIKPMTMAPPARTAYDIRYENTMSPFVRAKYGLGAGPPTSLNQLQEPRMASGAAAPIPAAISRFSPSGSAVQTPRLQPLQFGEGK